jgi:hypothetical protein
LNCPPAHSAHVRSADAVDAVASALPAAHGALTAAHASPLPTSENVAPTTQAAHWRSATLVPGTDMPSPMAHVRHRVHAVLAAALLNSPAAHVLHVRSELAVAMRLTYLPAAQGAEVAAQAAPSLLALNVAPTSQGAHWRSAEAVPSTTLP